MIPLNMHFAQCVVILYGSVFVELTEDILE